MSDKEYYIKGIGWVDWDEAHRLGFTLTKPALLTVYTEDLKSRRIVQCKDTEDYNKVYDSANHIWTDDLSSMNLIRQIGETELYTGSHSSNYFCYTTSVTKNEPTHIKLDDTLVEYSSLYSTKGITSYPCIDFFVENTVLSVWYDPVKLMYWDDRVGKKLWTKSVPDVAVVKEPEDTTIRQSMDRLDLWPQWEYDLSQIPITYRAYPFNSQDDLLKSQDPLLTGFQNQDQWNSSLNLTNDLFYPDFTLTNTRLFVYPEEGAVGFDGTNYEQGAVLTGDYKEVWVESDVDVDFYLGVKHFVYGQTHDDTIDEIYWCDNSEYKTYDSLHASGYTKTKSQTVEIFDPFMLDRVAWPDEMWLYFNANTHTPMTIPVIDGTVQPARFDSDNTDPYNSSVLNHVSAIAKQPGLEGNRLAVDYYWMDGATYYVYRDGATVETLRGYSPDSQYVTFNGMPNMGWYFAGRSPLSGGADISTLGIPVYYSNGIQARTVDFIGQRITGNLKVMRTKRSNDYTIVYPVSDLQAEINDFSFVDVDGLLYLRYSGPEPILGVCGISFTFDYNGSLDTSTLIEAYFTSLGDLETTEDVRQNSVTYTMYDRFGNQIIYDSTKTYTTINMLLKDGTKATYGDFGYYETYSDSVLKGRTNGNKTIYKLIIKVS